MPWIRETKQMSVQQRIVQSRGVPDRCRRFRPLFTHLLMVEIWLFLLTLELDVCTVYFGL